MKLFWTSGLYAMATKSYFVYFGTALTTDSFTLFTGKISGFLCFVINYIYFKSIVPGRRSTSLVSVFYSTDDQCLYVFSSTPYCFCYIATGYKLSYRMLLSMFQLEVCMHHSMCFIYESCFSI